MSFVPCGESLVIGSSENETSLIMYFGVAFEPCACLQKVEVESLAYDFSRL